MSPSGRYTALVIHGEGGILDVLTRWFEASDFDVIAATSAFRAQAHLEGERPVEVVVAAWDDFIDTTGPRSEVSASSRAALVPLLVVACGLVMLGGCARQHAVTVEIETEIAHYRKDPSDALAARIDASFAHLDGICCSTLLFRSGAMAVSLEDVWAGPHDESIKGDHYIRWRVEGTDGLAQGTIGWPDYPNGSASTLDYCARESGGEWIRSAASKRRRL